MRDIIIRAQQLLEKYNQGWPILSQCELTEIPYYGRVFEEQRLVSGTEESFYPIIRQFGWSMVFGVTSEKNEVLTLIQWKHGINQAEWRLPPGGIGEVSEDADITTILNKTREAYLQETGYQGAGWTYLGPMIIESGKYRGATLDSHGFAAHLWLADNLEEVAKPNPPAGDVYEILPVPVREFSRILDSGLFVEESSLVCAYKALTALGILRWA